MWHVSGRMEEPLRRLLLVALVVVVLGGLPACTSDGDAKTAAAEATAANLAQALTARRLADVPVEGGGQRQLDAIVAGIADIPATVTVDRVAVQGDTANATLAWQWETRGTPWRYQTTADLSWSTDHWTLQWAPGVVEPSLTEGESLEQTTEPAQRGDILGARDVPLVTHRTVQRFGIDKAKISATSAPESARRLARLLGIASSAYARRVDKAGPKAFVEALVLRDADATRIRPSALAAIPGAMSVSDQMPLAPTADFAAAILGRVGPATAEIIAKSHGAVRDEAGLSGLQERYDSGLAGTPGVVVAATGAHTERTLFTTDAVDGHPLRTTLDPRLQSVAESQLDGVGPASALVAIRPSTGDILVAASGPGSNGYNTATTGRYPPGSTMKVVTALALMRAGVQLTDPVPCTAAVVVNGRSFTNYSGYPPAAMGSITLKSAVANSCNTAIISQAGNLTGDDLTQAAAALGLGVDHDLGFPAYFGQVPAPTSETAQAESLIGQGKVLASPMAMAAVAASVVEGRAVVPRLLPDHQPGPQEQPARPLSQAEAGDLRDVMRAVVTEGTATFLRDDAGPPIGAKTGTAEFGTHAPLRTHAWMIAYQGDLAVAVFVEVGQSGSHTAGPILEQFLHAAR
jgi:cell division protein FtsI/penicillin-binding protein 2